MKNIILLRLISGMTVLLLTAVSVTFGSSVSGSVSKRNVKKSVEQEIKKLEREWYEAGGVRHDVAAVARLEADDIVITAPDGQIVTKSQDLESTKSGKEIYDPNPTFDDMKVRVYGNTAVSTFRITVTGSTDGKPFTRGLRVTNVWVKKNNRWQVVAAHFSNLAEPDK